MKNVLYLFVIVGALVATSFYEMITYAIVVPTVFSGAVAKGLVSPSLPFSTAFWFTFVMFVFLIIGYALKAITKGISDY